MRLGPLGGVLLLGGCLLAIIVAGIVAAGGSAGLGVRDAGGLALTATLALGGLGFGLLGLSGPTPMDRRSLRIGFAFLGVGQLASLASTAIAAIVSDPTESWPAIILLLVGGLAILIGGPVTVIALLISPGRLRRIGALFVSGFAVGLVGGGLVNAVFAAASTDAPAVHLASGAVALIGGSLMLIACGGLGLLAARSTRSDEAVA